MPSWADSHTREPAHATRTQTGLAHAHRRARESAPGDCSIGYPALRLGLRARIILASAEGLTNAAVAKRVGVTPHTVGKWRRRFREAGIQGLHDEVRPGRPRTYDDDKVASVINRALQETPDTATHWSTRALGQAAGISKSTVQRWLALFGVKPHLARTLRRCATSSGCTSTRPTTRWSCAWTRSRRFRRSIGCFRHQLLLPRPYLVLTKPLRLDIQCQRAASVKIGWKYLDD